MQFRVAATTFFLDHYLNDFVKTSRLFESTISRVTYWERYVWEDWTVSEGALSDSTIWNGRRGERARWSDE